MTFPSYDRHHSTYPCADHREDDGKDDAKKKERREGEGTESSTARELFDTTRLVWFLIFSLSLLFCRQREKNYASYMCGCGVCVELVIQNKARKRGEAAFDSCHFIFVVICLLFEEFFCFLLFFGFLFL
jgi:hypothetical protein